MCLWAAMSYFHMGLSYVYTQEPATQWTELSPYLPGWSIDCLPESWYQSWPIPTRPRRRFVYSEDQNLLAERLRACDRRWREGNQRRWASSDEIDDGEWLPATRFVFYFFSLLLFIQIWFEDRPFCPSGYKIKRVFSIYEDYEDPLT